MELLRRQPGGEESPGRQGLGTDWLNVGVWLGGQLWVPAVLRAGRRGALLLGDLGRTLSCQLTW